MRWLGQTVTGKIALHLFCSLGFNIDKQYISRDTLFPRVQLTVPDADSKLRKSFNKVTKSATILTNSRAKLTKISLILIFR
ncbi:hypothetical protein BEP19_04190 [Ammoniphilus oxalaticus]|uniref:Uncharacterized protein n=1 Tax=Ammoniphilus oxalaticus TaxID=66863 RepID=A0A419SLS6_9BACL|nr:hypothetical protein BEP19_04190 [Ammoniphilus oxalaticus]